MSLYSWINNYPSISLSIDLGYVKDESKGRVLAMAGEVERMLKTVINSLEAKDKTLEPLIP